MVPFIMLYKGVPSFKSVNEIQKSDHIIEMNTVVLTLALTVISIKFLLVISMLVEPLWSRELRIIMIIQGEFS